MEREKAFHIMDRGHPALLRDLDTSVASLGPVSPAWVAILPSTSRRPVAVTVFLSLGKLIVGFI